MAEISFTVDGDLLFKKTPSLRTVATITANLQAAMSRAYLESKYGYVKKYQKNLSSDFVEFDFWFKGIREGSWIGDLASMSPLADAIADKLSNVLSPLYEACSSGIDNYYYAKDESLNTDNEIFTPKVKKFVELQNEPPNNVSLGYSTKSISSNFSKAVSPLRSSRIQDGKISFAISSNNTKKIFEFDKIKATKIKDIVNRKHYYDPIRYRVKIVEMDETKNTALFRNLDSFDSAKQRLLFSDEESFNIARMYFGLDEFKFVGKPVIEYGSLDLSAGDVLFLVMQ